MAPKCSNVECKKKIVRDDHARRFWDDWWTDLTAWLNWTGYAYKLGVRSRTGLENVNKTKGRFDAWLISFYDVSTNCCKSPVLVGSSTAKQTSISCQRQSTIQRSIWMMWNSPRQTWIHHSFVKWQRCQSIKPFWCEKWLIDVCLSVVHVNLCFHNIVLD